MEDKQKQEQASPQSADGRNAGGQATEQHLSAGEAGVSINLDKTPTLYTDSVMITGNEDGVIFDFCQRVGPGPQMRVVSRIGMSREHARKLLMAFTGQMEREPGKTQSTARTVN